MESVPKQELNVPLKWAPAFLRCIKYNYPSEEIHETLREGERKAEQGRLWKVSGTIEVSKSLGARAN